MMRPRILVALALGAITSIVIAETLAYRAQRASRFPAVRSYGWIDPWRDVPFAVMDVAPDEPGFTNLCLFCGPRINLAGDKVLDRFDRPKLLEIRDGLPVPSSVARAAAHENGAVITAGWPFRCLWGASFPATPAAGWRTSGWVVLSNRVLPVFPISSGLAADSLFFAGPWFGLLHLPGWLRRQRRRRAGRCSNCGYDRSGLPRESACPECGIAAPPEASSAETERGGLMSNVRVRVTVRPEGA